MNEKNSKELLNNQKRLQDGGKPFLEYTKLLKVLGQYGELLIGGSCAYGTMVDRDIDLHIIPTDGKLDRRYRNAVIQSLLEMSDIGRLNIIDLVNFSYLDILSL